MSLWRSVLLCSVILVSGLHCHPEGQSKIHLENNGYHGILVSISDSIPEDLNLLERIQVSVKFFVQPSFSCYAMKSVTSSISVIPCWVSQLHIGSSFHAFMYINFWYFNSSKREINKFNLENLSSLLLVLIGLCHVRLPFPAAYRAMYFFLM